MTTTTNNNAVATASIADRMYVTIKGTDGNDIKITKKILMDTICHGMQISDADMVQFLTLCQVNQLNPFVRDAYLIKFNGAPAQMIVSKEAFMKRADTCPDFEGIESGVIGMNGDGDIKNFVGAFLPPSWELVGGWCKVYRKDRHPYEQQVSLKEYQKGQSTWKTMPLTMIRKVAEVQTLREAYPCQLGGMYVKEEAMRVEDADAEEISSELNEVKAEAKKEAVAVPDAPAEEKETDNPDF